jgi:Skp family chaperone for outer membrane proteins
VSFQYKNDKTNRPQFGLIAEQVAEVNPNLVVRNSDGEIYTVRYDAVNAMLLNEFLKEHRKVEKLEAAVADLAAQLQKVTAQVQMDSSSAKVAVIAR